MPLERLPATFNLKEAHKGFFPYSYISEDKIDYIGEYPKAEDYHPERMNEKRRKEFLAWHKEKVDSGAIFDCQKELSAYLKSDVQVLTQSMETFAKEMKELTGIDPTVECVTCLRLSKRECMLSFKNVLKKSALKKIYLQCFTAFFS